MNHDTTRIKNFKRNLIKTYKINIIINYVAIWDSIALNEKI
jgi:hypothetical protein